MLEDVARTCHLTLLIGETEGCLPPEEVKKWYDRCHAPRMAKHDP